MEPFTMHKGIAVPFNRPDIDTDAIIPKVFLKSIARTGFGKNLFNDWRYFDGDPSKPNPDFVLNQPRYRGAAILVAKENFGCGSSREHAAWALTDYGIRCVIAPSFADIFYSNSQKNSLLPAILPSSAVDQLIAEIEATPGYELTVDLPAQNVRSQGGLSFDFDIDPESKRRMLEGLDDISVTLSHEAEITAFEENRRKTRPWL